MYYERGGFSVVAGQYPSDWPPVSLEVDVNGFLARLSGLESVESLGGIARLTSGLFRVRPLDPRLGSVETRDWPLLRLYHPAFHVQWARYLARPVYRSFSRQLRGYRFFWTVMLGEGSIAVHATRHPPPRVEAWARGGWLAVRIHCSNCSGRGVGLLLYRGGRVVAGVLPPGARYRGVANLPGGWRAGRGWVEAWLGMEELGS